MDDPEYTTLTIRKETKEKLRKYGAFGESWDQLLNRLIEKFESLRKGEEKIKFVVITKASTKPCGEAGNWADTIAVINDKEDEPYLYIDADPGGFPEENILAGLSPFTVENNNRRFKIRWIRVPVFEPGEILIVDETGREVAGYCRKPSKWMVEYEEFDNLEEAIKRAREIMYGDEET